MHAQSSLIILGSTDYQATFFNGSDAVFHTSTLHDVQVSDVCIFGIK